MAWIRTILPENARGALHRLYDTCEKQFGFVPNIRRALSLDPAALRAYVELSGAVYRGGVLAAEEREMIATVVSALNRCRY